MSRKPNSNVSKGQQYADRILAEIGHKYPAKVQKEHDVQMNSDGRLYVDGSPFRGGAVRLG